MRFFSSDKTLFLNFIGMLLETLEVWERDHVPWRHLKNLPTLNSSNFRKITQQSFFRALLLLNQFRHFTFFKKLVSNHLLKAANLSLLPKAIIMFEEAKRLILKMKMDLSVHTRKLIATREIPSPKLLIKDHNTINEKGEFPTRLVVPATNCTATFSKIDYIGIKIILDKAKVKYSCVSIVQASNPKERL